MADFLFAALLVPRPVAMSLPEFLQIGMSLRRQAGIDGLERMLMHTQITASQKALHAYALHALRHAQQRLLVQVLQQMASDPGKADEAVQTVIKQRGIDSRVGSAAGLEQAVLDVWALSEAASSLLSVA